ncbi:DUF6929 family protein [Gelidibacter mesophilus]|uniref:DUF6929 family protein n=1 Tax=Gelidibacter mesophilus TaxID=169050 RepID=UPI000413664D|nr:hypothetical protein [Gelidibacter mesophilus]
MQRTELEIKILSWQVLDNVPSASGIVISNEKFYAVGDNSPYLFQLNSNFELLSKTSIYASKKPVEDVIPKIDKPDFEAMEMINDTEILIFGSGSKSPERDSCVLLKIGETSTYTTYNMTPFYDQMRALELMKGFELNIEALAIKDGLLYLFNRGRNIIFSFSYNDFMTYCTTGTHFPIIKTNLVSLPKINGLEAGFSGATTTKDQPYLIFTASVEDSPNAYDDGPILGSFIGVIGFENGEITNYLSAQQIPCPGFPLKIESVTIEKQISETETNLVVVTDNDGAPSEIIRLQMTL